LKEIWPDTMVEENNITVSMSILRKTLGEDRESPKFIETVPRRGYRFVAEVVEISTEEANSGKLLAKLSLRIRDTNHEFNMVYPFYLKEGTP